MHQAKLETFLLHANCSWPSDLLLVHDYDWAGVSDVPRSVLTACTKDILLHKWYIAAHVVCRCTSDILLYKWYIAAHVVYRCTSGISLHKWYIAAQVVYRCTSGVLLQSCCTVFAPSRRQVTYQHRATSCSILSCPVTVQELLGHVLHVCSAACSSC